RRALERGSRLHLDATLHGEVQEAHLDQPLSQGHLGLYDLHRHHPRTGGRPHVSADPEWARRRHEVSRQVVFAVIPARYMRSSTPQPIQRTTASPLTGEGWGEGQPAAHTLPELTRD